MKFSRTHDVMYRVLLTIVIYILFSYSFYLFFAGHNEPGGGFIGGLMAGLSLMLVYLFFGQSKGKALMKVTYPILISLGLLLSIGVGMTGVFVGDAFFTQYFDYFDLPFLGEVELTTAVPFDLGIFLGVIGMAMAATVTIAEDES
ncbi:MnhB domain-containing protein [Alkalihalobacillus pseudalcaliphilus]|uniref:MnhB domain-containing protein n=1 Tax=Alkalihalobacillus pseudalcaliphilus TaxID=79884 RepID=UPI00064D8C86|nr:MnhB domain-containing protein [Alkalihalobacillus pseudalcaliphilus]KMK77197.1 monovalent cation/H+ antiporter subunit B [Alkalihalobacillus pseudalcaliphilus]